jgi:hypothetical protein
MPKKNEIEVTYTRSNVSGEATNNLLANALKPVFEEAERIYHKQKETADTEKSD